VHEQKNKVERDEEEKERKKESVRESNSVKTAALHNRSSMGDAKRELLGFCKSQNDALPSHTF